MIEILGRRIGEREYSDDGERQTVTDVWVIKAAHHLVTRFAILDHPDLPRVGDVYSTSEGTILELSVSRVRLRVVPDSDVLWELEVEYATDAEEERPEDEEPLDRRPEVSIDYEIVQGAAEGALKVETVANDSGRAVETLVAWNKALVNSAGEPFDPQPEIDKTRPILNVTFNEPNINLLLLATYSNTVNSVLWMNCPPRTWKMNGLRVQRMRENNTNYVQVTMSFCFEKDTWDLQLLNQGTYYADAGDMADKQPFTDADGNRIVGLLTENGDDLADDADPTYSRYRVYRESDFNLLFTDSILYG